MGDKVRLVPLDNDVVYADLGLETLRRMGIADRYNKWIFQEFFPYIGTSLLEVGCGIGNMTAHFCTHTSVVALDQHPACLEGVQSSYPTVETHAADITDAEALAPLKERRFSSVACVNVLEHIEKDVIALQNMYDILTPGGHMLLFVPAGQYLFGSLDESVGHFRRYDFQGLKHLVLGAGFEIERLTYTNVAGIPGWWLNSRVLKRNLLPVGQLKVFDFLFPAIISTEKLLRSIWNIPIGQSLLCVATKK